MTTTRQYRMVTRAEFERAIYLRRNYDLDPISYATVNTIEAGWITSEKIEYCYFDTLRQLIDKYNL